jgi:hypothetical protein
VVERVALEVAEEDMEVVPVRAEDTVGWAVREVLREGMRREAKGLVVPLRVEEVEGVAASEGRTKERAGERVPLPAAGSVGLEASEGEVVAVELGWEAVAAAEVE